MVLYKEQEIILPQKHAGFLSLYGDLGFYREKTHKSKRKWVHLFNKLFYRHSEWFKNNQKMKFGRIMITQKNAFEKYKPFAMGEDPRVMKWQEKLYVLDSTHNYSELISVHNRKRTHIPLEGKNFTLLPASDKLYIAEWLCPLVVHEASISNRKMTLKKVSQTGKENSEYRGGTSGIPLQKNEWFGFLRRTYESQNEIKHNPYLWYIWREKNGKFYANISIVTLDKKDEDSYIIDPCSIFMSDGKYFLTTAESRYPWKKDMLQRGNNIKTYIYRFDIEDVKHYCQKKKDAFPIS